MWRALAGTSTGGSFQKYLLTHFYFRIASMGPYLRVGITRIGLFLHVPPARENRSLTELHAVSRSKESLWQRMPEFPSLRSCTGCRLVVIFQNREAASSALLEESISVVCTYVLSDTIVTEASAFWLTETVVLDFS
jgi:hypothetical protein